MKTFVRHRQRRLTGNARCQSLSIRLGVTLNEKPRPGVATGASRGQARVQRRASGDGTLALAEPAHASSRASSLY
jgi:hypothetical protein